MARKEITVKRSYLITDHGTFPLDELTPEQKEEVKKALAAGVPKATILTYFYPEVTVEKMSFYRKKQ